MISTGQLFITNVHTLNGTTISERKKNFARLLQENDSLKDDPRMLDFISEELIPRSHLEQVLKLDFQIYFKRTKDLFDLLKQGSIDEDFVSKILKQKWFIEAWCTDIASRGSEDFLNVVLPLMSYSVRMKVIAKISRHLNDEAFDQVNDGLFTKYGAFVAGKFITGCSACKIRQFLDNPDNNRLMEQLSAAQLRQIYQKDPALIDLYFDKIKVRPEEYEYQDPKDEDLHSEPQMKMNSKLLKLRYLLRFISTKNIQHFIDLVERHNFERIAQLGRRTTKKLVVLKKEEIIKEPQKFLHVKISVLFTKLGKESKLMLTNVLPFDMRDLFDDNECEHCATFKALVKHYPKRYLCDLYFKTVQEHYKEQIVNHPRFISEDILLMVQDKSVRAQLAKVAVNNGSSICIPYLENAIEYCKDRINHSTDLNEINLFLESAVKACCIDNVKDSYKLSHVMNFFFDRFRALSQNCDAFLSAIDRRFAGKDFGPDAWYFFTKIVVEKERMLRPNARILTLFDLESVSTSRKIEYLEYLFLNKVQDIDNLLISTNAIGYFTTGSYNRDFVKHCWTVLASRTESNEALRQHNDYVLIIGLEDYNATYKTDELCFRNFPALLETFNEVSRTSEIWFYKLYLCRKNIFNKTPDPFREEALKLYWEHVKVIDRKDLKWFLQFEPLQITQNLSKCMKSLVNNISDCRIRSLVRNYSHLSLDQEVIKYCKSRLGDFTERSMNRYVNCLSFLLTPEEFGTYAEESKPQLYELIGSLDDVSALRRNRLEARYSLRSSIAKCSKNTRSCHIFPELIQYYCHQDFSRFARESVCSISSRAPEGILDDFLNSVIAIEPRLLEQALLVAFQYLSVDAVERMVRQLFLCDDYRYKVWLPCMRYFSTRSPCDKIFDLLDMSSYLRFHQGSLFSVMCIVQDLVYMPVKYRIKYLITFCECIGGVFEERKNDPNKLYQISLLGVLSNSNIVTILSVLPLEFGMKCITDFGPLAEEAVVRFIFYFMVEKIHQSEFILEAVLNQMDKLEDDAKKSYFNHIYGYILEFEHPERMTFFNRYVEHWTPKLKSVVTLKEYIRLFFIKATINLLPKDYPDKFCQQLVEYLLALNARFGHCVLSIFRDELNHFNAFRTENISCVHCCYHLVERYPNRRVLMLVAKLLLGTRRRTSTYQEEKLLFNKTVKKLLEAADEDVQFFARTYLQTVFLF